MSCCRSFVASFCLGITFSAFASEPFEDCPTEAFIIQTPLNTPITYGVDLSTGSYSVLSPDMQTTKVNGNGFNFHDNYIYGWDYGAGTLARFGNDYAAEPLNVVSGLIGQSFYVGDVSLNENKWFGYRPGYGLYAIDISDPLGELVMERVATHTQMGNPKITDFAFHPTNGLIYVVDNNGFLRTIDPETGETILIGEVLNEASAGFNFTFGAQFFDVDNNLYISNNGNGYVYKVDTDQEIPEAIFFAYGPTSSSNDGARCALAPVVSSVGLDFGDAPESYLTSYDASGPRHGESSLFLGTIIDTEADAYLWPLSDDQSDNSDDDDGVNFVTGLEIGESAIVQVSASQSNGYLNAWVDFNGDGTFDEDEKIIHGQSLTEGANAIAYEVPIWAKSGNSWARFRISSTQNIGPSGGVSDGEVEDYPVEITAANISISSYPSSNSYTSIAFEDLWPIEGDYDMNDLLINLRTHEYSKDGAVIKVVIEGQVAAVGAGFNNGIAIQLPEIAKGIIKESEIELSINDQAVSSAGLELDQNYAVVVITENVWSMTPRGEGLCNYFRTEAGCSSADRPFWRLTIPFEIAVSDAVFPAPPYDPFIFATPNTPHSSLVGAITNGHPGKQWEVHLKNNAPTNALNTGLFGAGDDTSSVSTSAFYQTANGMPWAIEIPQDWRHPLEKVDIREAYPQFSVFAESGGVLQTDWYLESKAIPELLFQD